MIDSKLPSFFALFLKFLVYSVLNATSAYGVCISKVHVEVNCIAAESE